jgi:hypothetical protein
MPPLWPSFITTKDVLKPSIFSQIWGKELIQTIDPWLFSGPFPIECVHNGLLMDFILNFSWIHNGFLMEIGGLQCWEWCMVES